MLKTMMYWTLFVATCGFSASHHSNNVTPEKVTTYVYLDGEKTKVSFVDGDTFKIIDGDFKQTRVRIEGFNALETFGPVHSWEDNTPEYLFGIANDATDRAIDGTWHCTNAEEHDVYGRLLVICDDLALALLSEGLAHAYSINSTSAPKNYLDAQRKAQDGKLGMWKHGVPNYIITSLHSIDEGGKDNYNRLISTKDGKSKKWHHHESYSTCERVCSTNENSCMTYVPYEVRYGSNRAKCLL